MQSQSNIYDFAVVGLGAVGSSALYHLSLSGAKVLGLDRFDPPHTMGSSHGETRITRLAVGEGEDYVDLAKRSQRIWRNIEKESDSSFFFPCGGILMDSGKVPWDKHGSQGFMERTVSFAKKANISHRKFTQADVQESYPNFNLEESGKAYFENQAGYVFPEKCIKSFLDLSKANLAEINTHEAVLSISESKGLNLIKSNKGEYFAKKVLISAGGWIKDFLPDSRKSDFKICRQILHWIEVEPDFSWETYPVFMWGFGPKAEDFIYGFPSLDGKSIKVATESFVDVVHPDKINREVSPEEQREFWEGKVLGRLRGLTGKFSKSEVCFYTVTNDSRFVIQDLPDSLNGLWVSACSGHGFKHSAALGEQLAEKLMEVPLTLAEIR
ncbi:N-methyl-L-tryptophan oxidase [Algoriphagus sediminis]|uniref:N-methyl-L-tryptophan oxidase n=1 Tax=Algoriphagus sediminis TaxID=3057113 RepID=A0ABT7YBE3_9BACT|nr:N-methyl-L-tryptophan oxidase [Algoriphagus sediminis]MDN3203832.1 N-methyl-L-tryptophan oxidase [Algoriphagus sediminis]